MNLFPKSGLSWGGGPLRWAVAMGLAAVLAFAPVRIGVAGIAEVVDPAVPAVDGRVFALALAGNTLYVGGNFGAVGRNSGGGVALDERIGKPLPKSTTVAGKVYSSVSDGAGGWYIGGDFVAVGGQPRHGLAHILADGSLGDWAPSVGGSMVYINLPTVLVLAVDGDRIYVGGAFETIQGVARRNLAAVDRWTGAVMPWAPEPDSWVWTLAVRGGTVYAGGVFTSIGGSPRGYVAALDATTGSATDWNPGADYFVTALAVDRDVVYVGGYFARIGGANRRLIAELDAITGAATAWDAKASDRTTDYGTSPRVQEIVLAGNVVYVAGYFDSLGGAARQGLAALDAATGEATDWDPGFTAPVVECIAVRGRTVYIGGYFTFVSGLIRQHLAALDAETAAPTAWDPRVNGPVFTLAANGDAVFAGGEFSMVGEWQSRANLAAFDVTTGALKPWNPAPSGGIVDCLAVEDGVVYVGGAFLQIGGQARANLAAVDTLTGAATSWDPGANGSISTLMVRDGIVYTGGYFTRLGGLVRKYIGAIEASTGAVTAWDPGADYMVFDLAASGSAMYVGGFFGQIGGQTRRRIAALDLATGAATSWDPDVASGFVGALTIGNGVVYAGGSFSSIGGQAREGLAAIDVTTGRVTAWDPRPAPWALVHPRIEDIVLRDSVLYVGGNFSALGGQPRTCLAAVDTVTGDATAWDPGADSYVWSLLASGNTVYAGGDFTRLGGLPCAGLAAFSDSAFVPSVDPGSRWLSLAPIEPNPVTAEATLRFALASTAQVDLSVFDVQGRRVATLLHDDLRAAGVHELPIQVADWREGFYFCRLDAGGVSATRKLLVLR